jgi:ABC-type branched-subunit amino acid transport system substrate-binding protein
MTLLALACGPKRVVVDGRDMSVDEAEELARRDIGAVRDETAAMPPEGKAAALETFAARFNDIPPTAGEALYEAGVHWRAARQPQRAVSVFTRMLRYHGGSPYARDARYQLGLAEMEAGGGQTGDGPSQLEALYQRMGPEERLAAAKQAAEAAEAAGQWGDAARWRAEVGIYAGSETEKQEAIARAIAIIDQLSHSEAERLRTELPAGSPLLPAASMKVARILLHLNDLPRAEAAAKELLSRWPDSPYAPDAQGMLDRIARRTRVVPNVVGLALPLSGRFKAWGDAIQLGVSMAIAENSGIKVVVRDTRGEADGAVQAIEQLALDEGAIVIMGGVGNAEAMRAATTAQDLGVPFISLSKVEGVTQAGPYVFRNMLTSSAQARALAAFAFEKRRMKSFAIMYPNIPYGVEMANAFWDEVESRRGEIRGAEVYEADRTTFARNVKELVGKLYLDERTDYADKQKEIIKDEKDPYRKRKKLEKLRESLDPVIDMEAIFIPDFAKNVALIAPALAVEDVVTNTCDQKELDRIRKTTGREKLKAVQLLGGNGWDDPSLFDKAAKYVECAVFVDGFFAGSERRDTKRFVDAFKKKHDHPPTILEASAYDAARMVRQVLSDRSKPQARDAVRDLLVAIKGFRGVTGETSFDQNREPVKPLFFLTFGKQGLRELTNKEMESPGAGGP